MLAGRKAIREMVPIIDPEDDYLTIAAAEERMALTHEMRQKELHDAHTKLKRESAVSLVELIPLVPTDGCRTCESA